MMEDYEKLASDVSSKHAKLFIMCTWTVRTSSLLILAVFLIILCCLFIFSSLPSVAGMDPAHHPMAAEPNPREDRQ